MHIYSSSYRRCQLFLAGSGMVSYDYHHALQQTLYVAGSSGMHLYD